MHDDFRISLSFLFIMPPPLKKNDSRKRQQSLPNQEKVQSQKQLEGLNAMIEEYFQKLSLNKSLDIFRKQIWNASKPLQANSVSLMLNYFHTGQRQNFFKLYSKLLSSSYHKLKQVDPNKLQFDLHLHFLIYRINPIVCSPEQRVSFIEKQDLQVFKSFIESRGKSLSFNQKYVTYYALPFVQDPYNHKSFQHLFKEEWIAELSSNLKKTINLLFPRNKRPQIMDLFDRHVAPPPDSIALKNQISQQAEMIRGYQKRISDIQQNYRSFAQVSKNDLIQSQRKWFTMTQEIVFMARDLLNFIQTSKAMETPEIKAIRQRIGKYEHFVSLDLDDLLSKNIDVSLFQRHSYSAQPSHFKATSPILNYGKIKEEIMRSEPTRTRSLLQALRWRITHTRGMFNKREAVIWFVKNDLLGLRQPQTRILNKLFRMDEQVREASLRLANAFGDDYQGRQYFNQNSRMISLLIQLFKELRDRPMNVTLRVTISLMQKLSLRKQPQMHMINNGIIQDFVQMVQKNLNNDGQKQWLEYVMALLINLSLSSQGKRRCLTVKSRILKMLLSLVEISNEGVRTNVNGVFYSLFQMKEFRNQAKQQGIDQFLKMNSRKDDSLYAKQIQYILDKLKNDEGEYEPSDGQSNNDIDQLDDEEAMGSQESEYTLKEPFGQDLLAQFQAHGKQFTEQAKNIRVMVSESLRKRQMFENLNGSSYKQLKRPISHISKDRLKNQSKQFSQDKERDNRKLSKTPDISKGRNWDSYQIGIPDPKVLRESRNVESRQIESRGFSRNGQRLPEIKIPAKEPFQKEKVQKPERDQLPTLKNQKLNAKEQKFKVVKEAFETKNCLPRTPPEGSSRPISLNN